MFVIDGFMNFGILLQQSLRYQLHYKNDEENIALDLIPECLQIKAPPAFGPISENVNIKCNNISRDVERNLVQLLLYKSKKLVGGVELDLDF